MAISEFAVGAIHSSNKLVQDHFKASNVFVISVRRDTAGWLLVVPFAAGSGAHGRYFLLFQMPIKHCVWNPDFATQRSLQLPNAMQLND